MSDIGAPRHDPVPIGEVSAPPFARLPDPAQLFATRATRLRDLALTHELGPYLNFLGGLAEAQHAAQDGLPLPDLPAEDARERARQFGMPPLDRGRFVSEPAFETTIERLLGLAGDIEMPVAARDALEAVRRADAQRRDEMVRAVLADAIPVESLAHHVFVAAALQVHFSRIAARLDARKLVPVGDGVCPCCGGAPVCSVIVGWQQAPNTRFCVCSLCETWWHYVRIRCVACGTTKGIGYKEISERGDNVQAETCEECHSYVKILHQHKNPHLEPVADDVATLGLDLLVKEAGYRRAAFNPYLLGY
ncbi:MAG TPA: formate dehydrogenase accessory protein FdhE [Pseudorhodoplanes sp.]|jgi:FdhE protein|nr:formate dehydrogenase accessory protein FdhE [Pseudorhodoplanes sp.]